MSQKISFKQPNKYSQNSPECRILTPEFRTPPPTTNRPFGAQLLSPVQNSNSIRRRSAAFDVQQHKFREQFRGIEPFRYSCDCPYLLLDQVSFLHNKAGTAVLV
jgi:hypothetical protein